MLPVKRPSIPARPLLRHSLLKVATCSRPVIGTWRQVSHYSTEEVVSPLAYDHYEPPSTFIPDKQNSSIIFLHGLFGSKKNNRAVSKVLARDLGRHVYALDLRNHGESPHHQQHNYPAMARDVDNFMQQQHLRASTVIGHSMGAKVAMTLALQSPNVVSNIIAVDNAPIDAALETNFTKYVRAMKKIDAAQIQSQAEADEILQECEQSLAIRQFLLGNLHQRKGEKRRTFRIPLDVLGRSLDHMGDFPYRDPDTARFEKRALFIRGTQSKYVPDEALPVIGRFFPKFRTVDVDAGHWLISEQPEAFRKAVVDFLKPTE